MANAFLDAWTVSTPSSARAATAMRAVLLMGKAGLAGLPRTTGDKLALDAARSAASVGGGSDAIETIRLITGWMTEDGRSPFEAEGDFHDPELVALEQAERRQIAWSCMLLSVANAFDGGEQPWLDAMKLASFRITEALGYDQVIQRRRFGPAILREATEHARRRGQPLPGQSGSGHSPGKPHPRRRSGAPVAPGPRRGSGQGQGNGPVASRRPAADSGSKTTIRPVPCNPPAWSAAWAP